MSKMFARFCTNPNCQDEHPEPIRWSKGWAYCRPCYVRIYPAAALSNGIAKVDHPVIWLSNRHCLTTLKEASNE